MTLQNKINNYAGMFSTTKRGDETIVIFGDNATEKLKDKVRQAHGDRLPDDWIFETFNDILENLSNYDITNMEDVENYRHEIVDGLVSVYTSDLTAWLHSSNYNVAYLDDAVKEFGATDNVLGVAQYMAIDEIFGYVLELLQEDEDETDNE